MDLSKLTVRRIALGEDERYQQLLERHHYLGAIPKIGQTVRYSAQYGDICVALLRFSASSLKCGARDRWIGRDARLQFGRLKLIANNSRFLILRDWHRPNLGSKVLALCERRLSRDWLRLRRKRCYRLPSLSNDLMNVTSLNSRSHQREHQRERESRPLSDVCMKPDLPKVGMLQWDHCAQTVLLGYEHALQVLTDEAAAQG